MITLQKVIYKKIFGKVIVIEYKLFLGRWWDKCLFLIGPASHHGPYLNKVDISISLMYVIMCVYKYNVRYTEHVSLNSISFSSFMTWSSLNVFFNWSSVNVFSFNVLCLGKSYCAYNKLTEKQLYMRITKKKLLCVFPTLFSKCSFVFKHYIYSVITKKNTTYIINNSRSFTWVKAKKLGEYTRKYKQYMTR